MKVVHLVNNTQGLVQHWTPVGDADTFDWYKVFNCSLGDNVDMLTTTSRSQQAGAKGSNNKTSLQVNTQQSPAVISCCWFPDACWWGPVTVSSPPG